MGKIAYGFKGLEKATGLPYWTCRRFCMSEGMPTMKIGGRFLFDLDSVDAWLKSHETAGATDDECDEVGIIRAIKE